MSEKRSKLGPHVHVWNNTIFKYCKEVGASVIKSLDHNEMYLNEVRQAQPKALLVARHWVPHQRLDNPIQNARDFTEEMLRAIGKCPYDACEGYNEWDGDLGYGHGGPEGLENWKRYADFEAERSRILHHEGRKSIVGGCSVGTPPEFWFSHFRPALEEGDFLHLHEYSAPTMWDHVNWHCLKYRHVYRFLRENELPILPLIISECGEDGGVMQRPQKGWRHLGTKPKQYMEEWKWYDAELQKDDYVVGCNGFDCGATPGMGWQSFNLDPEILDLWAPYVRGLGVAYWEETPMTDKWKNVSRNIVQWKTLIGKVTQERHVPIDNFKGKPISPAKALACIVAIESSGDPSAVNPDTGATGLCQIMPMHFEEGQDPKDPLWNLRKGLSVLEYGLKQSITGGYGRNIQHALFYYSGSGNRPWQPFIDEYWDNDNPRHPGFIQRYKEFWGIDLEPSSNDEPDAIQEALGRIERAEAAYKAGYEEAKKELDAAVAGLLHQ